MTKQGDDFAGFPGPKEICTCGHTDEEHVELLISKSDLIAQGVNYPKETFLARGHGGMCMKCDCQRYTWARWTPEFEEELRRRRKG